jgi:phage I-like protein
MDLEPVRAAFTVPLSSSDSPTAPDDIQYMPPGRHTIRAQRAGKPVTLTVSVDASTAETLQRFLGERLAAAAEGTDDRPFLDFNHEDREAAAWPIAFFWAGDDRKTGGVRARIEWSEAGRRAVEGRTFRRFSPTFVPDEQGRVIGSEINMGGLVNRAAFKRIAALFARSTDTAAALPVEAPKERSRVDTSTAASRMSTLANTLHRIGILSRADADETAAVQEASTVLAKLRSDLDAANTRVAQLEKERTDAIRAKAQQRVIDAVKAGRIAPTDTESRKFWEAALVDNERAAVHALESIQPHSVLSRITPSDDGKARPRDLMAAQQKKLAEVRAAQPEADFATIFAKAAAEAPELFS